MECDLVVVTIFVNRLEFSSQKDFKDFPRDEAGDIKRMEQLGYVDVVFLPEQDQLDLVDQPLVKAEETFEMARRAELFHGKSIVLLGLLKLIEPSQIYVGLDCIQLQRHLRNLLDNQPIPVEVVGVPLCRRPDGLAYNTQVDLMTSAEIEIAKRVFPCLLSIIEEYLGGELDAKMMVRKARYELECPELLVDYFTLADAETFETLETIDPDKGGILIIGVVVKGKHKLMDNVVLAPLDRSKPKFFSRRVTKTL